MLLISQVGFGAIKLGKIDFYFDKKTCQIFVNLNTYLTANVLDVIV